MRIVALVCLILISGCRDQTPPSAYQHPRDQFFAVLPMQFINDDFYPCFRQMEGKPDRLDNAECYKFGKPQRMRGVVDLFLRNSGGFYPGIIKPPASDDNSQYWLELDLRAMQQAKSVGCEHCYLYLEFTGRRTLVPGRHGHLGKSKHILVIDEILKAKNVGQRGDRSAVTSD